MRKLLAYLKDSNEGILADVERVARAESPSRDVAALNRVSKLIEEWLTPFGKCQRTSTTLGDIAKVRIPGKRTERLVLLAHLDTVYPIGSWKQIWRIEADKAFGPGTYDMKAGVVQAVWALRAIQAAGLVPSYTIDFLLTPDEEIGSEASRSAIENIAKGAAGVLVLEAPYMTGDLKVARKGVGDYFVKVRGKAAHQGLEPENGRNAVVSAAHFIQECVKLQDWKKGTTIGPNVIHGGTVSNVVADESDMEVDLRVWTLEEARRVEAGLRQIQPLEGTSYEFTGGLNRPPMEPTDGSMKMFARAQALARELGFEVGAARVGGGSDGNFTAPLAPTLDGFGAFGAGAHQKDLEYIHIPSLAPRTALLAGMLLDRPN